MKRTEMFSLLASALFMAGCGGGGHKNEAAPVRVKTVRVGLSALSGSQTYSGTIEETFGTVVALQTGGTITQLPVSEGQTVSEGQLLAVVDARAQTQAVEASEAQTKQATDALAQAQDFYDRMKLLHDNGSVAEVKWIDAQTKLRQAQSAVRAAQASENIYRKQLGDTRLYAPYSGYVSNKLAEVGQVVGAGTPVAKIVKIDQVKVKISVPESEIGRISKGQTVSFRVEALGGETFTGTVSEKGVSANPMSHTYEVKAVADNASHKLLPGMVCSVETGVGNGAAGVVLPADIVQLDFDNRPFVWTVAGGKAHKAYVETGDNVSGGVTIAVGLADGDLVITEGQHKVSEGMAVATAGK